MKWCRIMFRKVWLTLRGRKYVEIGRGRPNWKLIEFIDQDRPLGPQISEIIDKIK